VSTSTAPTQDPSTQAPKGGAPRDWEDPRFWALVIAVALVLANALFHWNLGTTETLLVSTLLAYSVGKSVVTAAQTHAQASASNVQAALNTVASALKDVGALVGSPAAGATADTATATGPSAAETTTGGAS